MNHKNHYLLTELPHFIALHPAPSEYSPMLYRWICVKRFVLQTSMILIFQSLIILHLPFTYPALPMHPPIGVAFVFFFLLGQRALLGLGLAGFLGYFFQSPNFILFSSYFLADLMGGALGAYLCQKKLSSDINPFGKKSECFAFIVTVMIVCVLSGVIRMLPFIETFSLSPFSNIYYFLSVWFADLNAILIMAGFLLSWAYVPFSREKILPLSLSFLHKGIHLTILLSALILAAIFMQQFQIFYVIFFLMFYAFYLASVCGYLIAMALLFGISALYLTYFLAHHTQVLLLLDLPRYMVVPGTLLLFTLAMWSLGQRKYSIRKEKAVSMPS